jgi:hypothetical protein
LVTPRKPRYRPTPPRSKVGLAEAAASERAATAANLRPLEAVNDMVSILRAGKNVVSCSVFPLVYLNAVAPAFTDPLRDAALAGGASFFTTGIDSGLARNQDSSRHWTCRSSPERDWCGQRRVRHPTVGSSGGFS